MRDVSSSLNPLAFVWVPYLEWGDFVYACAAATVAVISAEPQPDITRQVAALRGAVPTGLVWLQGGLGAVATGSVRLDGVVVRRTAKMQKNPQDFSVALHKARTYGFLRTRAWALRAEPSLSREMRRYLMLAMLTDPPFRLIEVFSAPCGCKPGRMQARFRAEANTTTPKELLQWVLIVHIGMRRPFGRSWEWLANRLDYDVQVFLRTTRKLLDATPSECEEGYGERVMNEFDDYLTRSFGLDRPERPHRTRTGNTASGA